MKIRKIFEAQIVAGVDAESELLGMLRGADERRDGLGAVGGVLRRIGLGVKRLELIKLEHLPVEIRGPADAHFPIACVFLGVVSHDPLIQMRAEPDAPQPDEGGEQDPPQWPAVGQRAIEHAEAEEGRPA